MKTVLLASESPKGSHTLFPIDDDDRISGNDSRIPSIVSMHIS